MPTSNVATTTFPGNNLNNLHCSDKMITHASLFSGIGAPELAASWMGWRNVFHCEINPFCRKVLHYWFPESISYDDITTTDFTKFGGGKITVLTGGFPCQPFSSAGKRAGANDNRYLWPQMLRAIQEIMPSYVIGENVAGILSMVQHGNEVKLGSAPTLFNEDNEVFYQREQQFIVETVCSDLEREGYSVQPIIIPACAVGAPHIRNRVWFIAKREPGTTANANDTRVESSRYKRFDATDKVGCSADTDCYRLRSSERNCGREWQAVDKERENKSFNGIERLNTKRTIADTICLRRQTLGIQDGQFAYPRQTECGTFQSCGTDSPQHRWRDFPTQSPVCRGNDGVSIRLDNLSISFNKWRNESIKAYGNSMVPQVVYEIFQAIQEDIDRTIKDKQ